MIRAIKFIIITSIFALGALNTTPAHAKCNKKCPKTQRDANGCCKACDAGKTRTKTSEYLCCWPGQGWSKSQNQCIGVPQCPANTTLQKGTCVHPQTSKAKRVAIRQLLIMTGSIKLGMLSVDRLIVSYQNLLPQVPSAFWKRFRQQFNEDVLLDLIIPVYDKHLSHDDIKALIVFYNSPVGKKYVKVMPDIQRESKIIGQRWGLYITQAIETKLKGSGYIKTKKKEK